jgi:hypothetical protein
MFLSAEDVTISFESCDMSMESTGNYDSRGTVMRTLSPPQTTKIYLVPVEGDKKFQRVLIEHFDSGVKKCDCEKFSVGAVANGQDVVGHFKSAGVDQGYGSPALMQMSCTVKRKPL